MDHYKFHHVIKHVSPISRAQCKTAVSTLLTPWRYCGLALNRRYVPAIVRKPTQHLTGHILYTGNAFPCLNPSWTQIRIFRNNKVNTLVANALARKLRQDISIEYAKYTGPFRSSRIISATWVFSLVHIDTIKPIRMFHLHFFHPLFHTYQHNADYTKEDMICFPHYPGNGNENKWHSIYTIKISRLCI